MTLPSPWNTCVGRLRTRLTVPDGLPAPRIMPVAPRKISARSMMAESLWMNEPPPLPCTTVAPSYWMASIA
ncbi:hypothetical protein D3C72_2478390 [compost metagenome]